jgi:hypothetical protein
MIATLIKVVTCDVVFRENPKKKKKKKPLVTRNSKIIYKYIYKYIYMHTQFSGFYGGV